MSQLKAKKVLINWREAEQFQPKGFKKGSKEGILKSLKEGIIGDLFTVFTTKSDKKYRIFDGHSRQDVMFDSEHYNEWQEKYECSAVEFENDKEAAEALIRFQAGKLAINGEVYREFVDQYEIEENYNEIYEVAVIEEESEEQEKENNTGKFNNIENDIFLKVKMVNQREAEQLYNELQNKGYECKIIS